MKTFEQLMMEADGNEMLAAMDDYIQHADIEDQFDPMDEFGVKGEDFAEYCNTVLGIAFSENAPGQLSETDLLALIAVSVGSGIYLERHRAGMTPEERDRKLREIAKQIREEFAEEEKVSGE